MKIYITFGQAHTHSVNGKTFDKDCIAEIECEDRSEGETKAFEYFGSKFCSSYTEEEIGGNLHYYPRGIMKVENNNE